MATSAERLWQSRILIVDDTPLNVTLLEEALAEYQRSTARDGEEALRLLLTGPRPDLVLLDVIMPGIDGFEVLRRMKASPALRDIPVIFITALGSEEDETAGITLGAVDYITKPFNAPVVRARVHTHLQLAHARAALAAQKNTLEEEVARRTAQLAEVLVGLKHASHETILRLARASEFKDEDTGTHLVRMSLYAAALARRMGLLPDEVERLLHAAPMHDVGKIGVPDQILRKQGRLTEQEWEVMRQHTQIGAEILAGSTAEVIRLGETVARSHHERWDGNGYPQHLRGPEIPLPGRILAAADVLDALTSKRPYREPLTFDEAIQCIRDDRGKHFDPDVVDAMVAARDELVQIREGANRPGGGFPGMAIATPAASRAACGPQAPAAGPSAAGPGNRILVVDDDEISRTILATMLQDEGHDMLEAASGEDALTVIDRGGVDLVLTDVIMPGMDGFELCRNIRDTRKILDLPVVFITSLEDQESRVLGKDAGGDDFLCKPVDRIELFARVRNLLRVKAYHDLRARQQETLARELERMQGPLLHVDRLGGLGTLATGVGHELEHAAARLAQVLAGTGAAADALPEIEAVATLLATHARQLLNLGRSGPEALVDVDLREVVGRTIDMLKVAGKAGDAAIAQDFPPGPLPVRVHRTRMELAVLNLVENAVDAVAGLPRERGSIVVSLAADRPAPGRVTCRIQDQGCGIPGAALDRVFEPYFTTKAGRSGLGLTVARGVVASLGGLISVDNPPGGGAAVTFDLPLVPPEAGNATSA